MSSFAKSRTRTETRTVAKMVMENRAFGVSV
jgi:hypothetical protein